MSSYWYECTKHNIKIIKAEWKERQYMSCPICVLEQENKQLKEKLDKAEELWFKDEEFNKLKKENIRLQTMIAFIKTCNCICTIRGYIKIKEQN